MFLAAMEVIGWTCEYLQSALGAISPEFPRRIQEEGILRR